MAFDQMGQQQTDLTSPQGKSQAWQAQQEALQTGLGALQGQIAEAGKTGDIWANLQKAGEAQTKQGMDALRRQAAQALYASRGSLGGGGGLAGLQQQQQASAANMTQAVTQANAQRAQLAAQAQQAQMGAQEQIAQAAGARYKMLQEQTQRQNRINQALDAARQVMQRNAGTIYTTADDKKRAADQIRSEVLAVETDPAVIQAIEGYISDLTSGRENVAGTIDL